MKRVRLTILDGTLQTIDHWADVDGITRGRLVDMAVDYYAILRREQQEEEQEEQS